MRKFLITLVLIVTVFPLAQAQTPVRATAQIVKEQTGTSYAIVNADAGKLLTFSNASPVAVSIAQAGTAGSFAAGWFIEIKNLGAGTVTITPTTSTIGGAPTLVLVTGQSARVHSNGSNYLVAAAVPALISTGPLTIGADSEASGTDGVSLQTRGTTRLRVNNDGVAESLVGYRVTKSGPYAFLLLDRTDQPSFPRVQVDIDSGSFVLTPQTGVGLLDQRITIEGARLDGSGTQLYDWGLNYERFQTTSTLFRFMDESGTLYRDLVAKHLTLDGAGSESTLYVTQSQLIIRDSNTSAVKAVVLGALTAEGVIIAGSAPTTLTDSAGKILSAALNTVAVGQGGTGLTAPGTSGNVLTSNGSAWVSQAPSAGDALVANPLSQFAATTSAQLAGVISNETGSGALVFGTAPTLSNAILTGTTVAPAADGTSLYALDVSGSAGIVLANDATSSIFGGATFSGLIFINNISSGETAIIITGAGAVKIVSQISSEFTIASGTGSRTNIYLVGNAVTIENKLGITCTYKIIAFRTRTSQ